MRTRSQCPAAPASGPGSSRPISAGLLGEGAVPNGSIVDAGAQYGRWSCYYAATAPDRTVRAVDPSHNYTKEISLHGCKNT